MDDTYTVSIHRDGNHVHLFRRDKKAKMWRRVESVYIALDKMSGDRLCGSRIPQFLWSVPLGKPKYYTFPNDDELYPDEKMLDNSVGELLYTNLSRVLMFLDDKGQGTEVVKLPISQEQTDALWPDMAWLNKDDDDA